MSETEIEGEGEICEPISRNPLKGSQEWQSAH